MQAQQGGPGPLRPPGGTQQSAPSAAFAGMTLNNGPPQVRPPFASSGRSTTAEALSDFYHVHRHLKSSFALTGVSTERL